MANQLFKNATSIGANVNEAPGAGSKNDFKHKCKAVCKKTEETRYWLRLCEHEENYQFEQSILNGERSIIKVLGKIISSTN